MFKSNNRAVLIGEPTCGTTGTPLLLRLSMGGMARICSVRYALLDGTEFIGRGIAPHVAYPRHTGRMTPRWTRRLNTFRAKSKASA